MKSKILILGAGWYGCHLGLYLKEKGHNIKIYEKDNQIFSGSSGKNQFRFHQGYHYPRSLKTIEEIKKNFFKFKKKYKKFITFPKHNIYELDSMVKPDLITSGTLKNCNFINTDNTMKQMIDKYIPNLGILNGMLGRSSFFRDKK